jgi:hypothetical protein
VTLCAAILTPGGELGRVGEGPIIEEGDAHMTIEITRPEVEAIINQRLLTGKFKDAEDVILQALRSVPEAAPADAELRSEAKDQVELFAPVRGLFADGELDFSRNPSTGRPLDLS